MEITKIQYTNHMKQTTAERAKNIDTIINYCSECFEEHQWRSCDKCPLEPICGDRELESWSDLSDSALEYITSVIYKEKSNE